MIEVAMICMGFIAVVIFMLVRKSRRQRKRRAFPRSAFKDDRDWIREFRSTYGDRK